MIVRLPGQVASTREDLVELTDVTATLVGLAGCQVPGGWTATLPGWPGTPRDRIIEPLGGGWACDGGRLLSMPPASDALT